MLARQSLDNPRWSRDCQCKFELRTSGRDEHMEPLDNPRVREGGGRMEEGGGEGGRRGREEREGGEGGMRERSKGRGREEREGGGGREGEREGGGEVVEEGTIDAHVCAHTLTIADHACITIMHANVNGPSRE